MDSMSLFGTDEEGQILPGYKGLLSTYAEWHSLIIGFYHSQAPRSEGIPPALSNKDSPRYNADVDKEPHMAKYGYVLGEYAKYAVIVLLGIHQI